MSSFEISNSMNASSNKERKFVQNILCKLYKKGYITRSSCLASTYGYIYSLLKDYKKINIKLFSLCSSSVRESLKLIMTSPRVFTYEELRSKTGLSVDEMENWLRRTFSNWGYVKSERYKGFIVFYRYDIKPDYSEIDKSIDDIKSKIRIEGLEFEKKVFSFLERLRDYLRSKGHSAELIRHPGTPEGKYLDAKISLKLFGILPPIQLLIEIKSFVVGLNQVVEFLQKIRHFDGVILPVMIAYGFNTNVYIHYRSENILLVTEKHLKELERKISEVICLTNTM
ncbi:MAG: hypothetical protein QXX38_01420 [Candidatus Aenigmatarchaeota archaeon]